MSKRKATEGQLNFIRSITYITKIELKIKLVDLAFEDADDFIAQNKDQFNSEYYLILNTVKKIINKLNIEGSEELTKYSTKVEDIIRQEEFIGLHIEALTELEEKRAFDKVRRETIKLTRQLKIDYFAIEEENNLDNKEKVEQYLDDLKSKIDLKEFDEDKTKKEPIFRVPKKSNLYGNILYHHHKVMNMIKYDDVLNNVNKEALCDEISTLRDANEIIDKLSKSYKNKIYQNHQISTSFSKEDEGLEFLVCIGNYYPQKGSDINVSGETYMIIPITISMQGSNQYKLSGSIANLITMNTKFLDPTHSSVRNIIGTVENYNKYLKSKFPKSYKWEDYLEYAESLFKKVTGSSIYSYKVIRRYSQSNLKYLVKINDDVSKANININRLLVDLSYKKEKEYPELLKSILVNNQDRKIIRNRTLLEYNTLNIDEYGGDKRIAFPLDPSQKDALNCMCCINRGEVLSIQGPPGSGKTSMLKAVIATEVGKFIKNNRAPVILACGSTNQSVTNIIGSFADTALEFDDKIENMTIFHRWVKGIKSYGWYAPSSSKLKEEKEKLKNTNILTIDYLESEYRSYFKVSSAAENLIKYLKDDYKGMEQNYINTFNSVYDTSSRIGNISEIIEILHNEYDKYSINGIKQTTIKRVVSEIYDRVISKFEGSIYSISIKEDIKEYVKKEFENKVFRDYLLGDFIKEQFVDMLCGKLFSNLPIYANKKNLEIYEYIDNLYEVTCRTYLFHIAMRILEGVFLLETKKLNDISTELTLEHLCMLAPIVVSTFKSASKLCSFYDSEDQMHKHNLEEVDLLIVDEAGQATPEDGSSVFALAKKAIVVGDTFQIEPVWEIVENSEDIIIKQDGRIEKEKDEYNPGILCSSGSVMQMAQFASKFSIDEADMPYGLMLRNHYRCVPNIIQFCNELVYKGKLVPVTKDKDSLFYSFVYAPIESMATKSPSGSWQNKIEAEAIASWLANKAKLIIDYYSKKEKKGLEELVAIVTPFSSQSYLIRRALENAFSKGGRGLKLSDEFIIGTTHALQGAEKPIVLFSGVSTPGEGDSDFIDNSTSLLNVAVSRAKDSFIFFGHPDRYFNLDSSGDSPSHVLSTYINNYGKRLFPRKIVIVESPTKAKKIKGWLSIDYKVFATKGHFLEISSVSEDGNYTPEFEPKEHIGEIDGIIELLNDCDELIIATDDDREGEAIGWHFLERVKKRFARLNFQIKRIRFSEISNSAINYALNNYEDGMNQNIVDAALSRSIIDFVIGKKLNLFIKEKYKEKGLKSPPIVGRVRNLVLHEINNYTKDNLDNKKRYRVIVNKKNSEDFGFISTKKNEIYFTKEEVLKIQKELLGIDFNLIGESKLILNEERGFGITRNPSTADILKIAYDMYGYSPKKTMSIMQELYEMGGK